MQALLAYIGGSFRSGSTLISFLLNNHPHVVSVGEFERLKQHVERENRRCTCGRHVLDCPFWRKVEGEVRESLGTPDGVSALATTRVEPDPEDLGRIGVFVKQVALAPGWGWLYTAISSLLPASHRDSITNTLRWHEAIRRATGCPVVCESSKGRRRLKALYLADPKAFRLVYMIRDGRGVAASSMRRRGDTMEKAARTWLRDNRRGLWNLRGIPKNRVMFPHYEDLCRNPRPAMHKVCDFLGLSFDERVTRLFKGNAHMVGGNPMQFRTDEVAICLDERWREQLSADDLAVFDRVAGAHNRRLGYTD